MTPRALPLLGLLVGACAAEMPVVPRSDEPAVYVVLTLDSLVAADPHFPDDARLTAVVATTGVPWEFEFRDAERFDMREESDARRFAWGTTPVASTGGYVDPGAVPIRGNYVLEEHSGAAGRGRSELRAGERYLLSIETAGRTVTGATVIPSRPRPVVVRRTPVTEIAWPPATGAALYVVSYGYPRWQHATTDTSYVLPRVEGPQPADVSVMAVDPNWAAFFRDRSLMSSGITGGHGLFGATAEARLSLAP